jgi:hypothetical protein
LASGEKQVGVMSYAGLSAEALDYAPCRYGTSKILFRGPQRRTDAPYVAVLGGNETYGKYIKTPFPALVETDLGVNCINFGVVNAGVDVFLNDETMLDLAQRSEVTVLQVVGAQNMSNRFYTVHPRRNDRFVAASERLSVVFPEVDFAEFHFNRHMLSMLHSVSKERFAIVRAEVQTAWLARMKLLLDKIGGKIVLVWFASHAPYQPEPVGLDPSAAPDPLFVTSEMLEQLRPLVEEIVVPKLSGTALSAGTDGMVFDDMERLAAQEMLGPKAHAEFARELSRTLQRIV